MLESDRVKLLFGPYRMPRCRVGGFLKCSMRGKVTVRGIHEALIQWPYTLQERCGRPLLILCGALARAVRRESEVAVAHWWGVSQWTVWKWRKELGVDAINKGTSALLSRMTLDSIQSDDGTARRMEALNVQNALQRSLPPSAESQGRSSSKKQCIARISAAFTVKKLGET
jgi:hypothetical protein